MEKVSFLFCMSFQGPFNSWTPFSGVLQQQAQIPGLPQFSLPTLEQLAGLFPNQIPFSGQASFTQAAQASPLDPSQPQTAPQTQHGPNHVSQLSILGSKHCMLKMNMNQLLIKIRTAE